MAAETVKTYDPVLALEAGGWLTSQVTRLLTPIVWDPKDRDILMKRSRSI